MGRGRSSVTGENGDMADDLGSDRVLRLACDSNFHAIRQVLLRVTSFLQSHDLDQNEINDLQLVLAEAMTNIARHAYPSKANRIWLLLVLSGCRVTCHLSDRGVAFDPTDLGEHPPEPALRSEGGYGWFIIRSLSDGLTYTRRDGRNTLTFSIPRMEMT